MATYTIEAGNVQDHVEATFDSPGLDTSDPLWVSCRKKLMRLYNVNGAVESLEWSSEQSPWKLNVTLEDQSQIDYTLVLPGHSVDSHGSRFPRSLYAAIADVREVLSDMALNRGLLTLEATRPQ